MLEGWLKPEQNCKFYWKTIVLLWNNNIRNFGGLLSIDSVRFLAQKILGNLSSDFLFEKRKQKSVKNCFVKNRLQIDSWQMFGFKMQPEFWTLFALT